MESLSFESLEILHETLLNIRKSIIMLLEAINYLIQETEIRKIENEVDEHFE